MSAIRCDGEPVEWEVGENLFSSLYMTCSNETDQRFTLCFPILFRFCVSILSTSIYLFCVYLYAAFNAKTKSKILVYLPIECREVETQAEKN